MYVILEDTVAVLFLVIGVHCCTATNIVFHVAALQKYLNQATTGKWGGILRIELLDNASSKAGIYFGSYK